MKLHRRLALPLLLLTATGCMRYGANNVVYSGRLLTSSAPAPTTRLFIDRNGDIYPSLAVNASRLRRDDDALALYYRRAQRQRAPEWQALLERYRVADGDFGPTWTAVQDSIANRAVRSIAEFARTGTLVVLVHGFNNTGPQARVSFDSVRNAVRQHGVPGNDPRFLEVYWDGLTTTRWPQNILGVWGGAQHNGFNAGLALRRVLSGVSHDTPVRILTHSHGAAVAAAALWNVQSKLDPAVMGTPWHCAYLQKLADATRYRTPTHPDLRLGMIVPAIPGNVLADYAERTPKEGFNHYERVIIGQNADDAIITKFFIPSAWLGSTTLGGRFSEYEQHSPALMRVGEPERVFCIDFAGSEANQSTAFFWDKHDWRVYMERDAASDFLTLLFHDSVPSTPYRCGRR